MKTAGFLACAAFVGLCASAQAQGTFILQATAGAQGVTFSNVPANGANAGLAIAAGNAAAGGWQVEVLRNGSSLFSGAATIASLGRINNSSTTVSVPGTFGGESVTGITVRLWSGAASYALAQSTVGAIYGSSVAFSQSLGGVPNGGGNALPNVGMGNMLAFSVVTVVPEPSTIALAGLGLGGLLLARRKKA